MPAYRVSKPPVIDGVVDEATEWLNAPSLEISVDSMTQEAAPERARVWLEYDDNYLYFAAKMHDAFPKSIRAIEYRTNVSFTGEDFVELDVSTSGNLSDFDVFQMNANGATSVQLAGGRAAKREWAGEILSKGRITQSGWEVETRIPWQILRLPGPGKHDIRFNVQRHMPRTSRTYAVSYTQNGYADNTPVWSGVMLPTLATDRSIKFLPYILGGYDRDTGLIGTAGLDVKTNLNQGVTLVGSLNPDFRNIENQVLSIDFSRFPRLAQESRPFFQEGASYLGSNIFASQMIGHFDAGLNMYGKLDPRVQFGLLNTVQFGHEEDLVSTATFTPNPFESYRAAFTQHSTPDDQNSVYLFRYSANRGDYGYFVRDSGSRDSFAGSGENDNVDVSYGHKGFYSELDYDRVTPNYSPALGFVPEVDLIGPSLFTFFDAPLSKGPIIDRGYGVIVQEYNHVSGGFYRDEGDLFGNITLRNQISLQGHIMADRFQDDQDHLFTLTTTYPQNNDRSNVSFAYTTGMETELPYSSYTLGATYLYRKKLSTNLSEQWTNLGGATTTQVILSGTYDLSKDRSVSCRLIQLNSGTNFFASFQQSGNRGIEYFIILGDPNAAVIDNPKAYVNIRPSLIFKAVIPFEK
jgi:hypothetical protein